nr:hypothetical protein CFP56_72064 [Quercus suber]
MAVWTLDLAALCPSGYQPTKDIVRVNAKVQHAGYGTVRAEHDGADGLTPMVGEEIPSGAQGPDEEDDDEGIRKNRESRGMEFVAGDIYESGGGGERHGDDGESGHDLTGTDAISKQESEGRDPGKSCDRAKCTVPAAERCRILHGDGFATKIED